MILGKENDENLEKEPLKIKSSKNENVLNLSLSKKYDYLFI